MANPVTNVRKFVPEHFLQVLGKNLPAILEAVNTAHETTEELVQACIDQLFLATAQGRYLVQLGEEKGFTMPSNSGLDIRAYRVLVPIMVSNPKQVRISMDELIQAFYGNERTKPGLSASELGPYSLLDGDDLILETESGNVAVSIVDGQVSDLTNVSASEIAAVINSSQSTILGEAIEDRQTGKTYVRLSSKTSGSGAFVRVAGGTLQNVLKFPEIAETSPVSGTVWNLTKTHTYTDLLRFEWNGAGTNPDVFRSSQGDVITIRGLVDGAQNFSDLNGSYEAVDVGYDYFIIRNDKFDHLTATLNQPDDDSIVFTKNKRITLYDNEEFALSSETETETITITVPAIPPLARRFLAGSAHLHGWDNPVIDFTRGSIKIGLGQAIDKPVAENLFLLSNGMQRPNFKQKYYHTTLVDSSTTTPLYTVDANDDQYAVLPYTVPIAIGTDPIYAEVDSDLYRVDFPFRHGLQYAWGFTLASCTGASNVTAGDLNKEHQVARLTNNSQVKFRIKDGLGVPIVFDGIAWGTADVDRHAIEQADGSDFYLTFPSAAAAIASGLTPGISFKLDPASGVDVEPYLASLLKFRKLSVATVVGDTINISAGLGPGPEGSIITGVSGYRSGYIGGSPTYFFDKTSDNNTLRVMNDLQCLMVAYTEPSNPLYVGSFLYDPTGSETVHTVSGDIVRLTDNILRGSNVSSLLVDTLEFDDGTEFPQSGELILDYGFDTMEGPIRFYAAVANPGSNQILIDPAYKFRYAHAEGAQVQYIHNNAAYVPEINGADYPVYLTGTVAARETLFNLVELLVAAGIFVEEDIILPDQRYDDSSIEPFG
jgi:hypothetical protein